VGARTSRAARTSTLLAVAGIDISPLALMIAQSCGGRV